MNVSTRADVQGGENVLIGGLIITGDAPKSVIMRAIGPSLSQAGVTNVLRDPTLSLFDSKGSLVAANDNWRSNAAAVQATGLAPKDDAESAIVVTLAPGAYTAVLSGVAGARGVALFELYDLGNSSGTIANIATRGKVGSGDGVMIGGFIIGGDQPAQVVVRAVGPSLERAGITGALSDPVLELYNSAGSRIFQNDDWRAEQESQIEASGLAPADDREAAITATLPPGNYTAIVRGAARASGVALVEVYNVGK